MTDPNPNTSSQPAGKPAGKPACIVCETTSSEAPLVVLTYEDQNYYICPTHLPILIHKPSQLAGLLPGAQNLRPSEGH